MILGGHPDESISQRTARAYLIKGDQSIFGYMRLWIDFWFKLLAGEDNHCVNSLGGESNAKELWDWSKTEEPE